MDILVATARDFARLHGGQPVASGTWDAVLRAHAVTAGARPPVVALVLALRDGSEFVARDDAPGWDDLVEAAEAALPGMRVRGDWESALHGDASIAPLLLFERSAPAR